MSYELSNPSPHSRRSITISIILYIIDIDWFVLLDWPVYLYSGQTELFQVSSIGLSLKLMLDISSPFSWAISVLPHTLMFLHFIWCIWHGRVPPLFCSYCIVLNMYQRICMYMILIIILWCAFHLIIVFCSDRSVSHL